MRANKNTSSMDLKSCTIDYTYASFSTRTQIMLITMAHLIIEQCGQGKRVLSIFIVYIYVGFFYELYFVNII